MKPQKVLHIIGSSSYGGVAKYVLNLIKNLQNYNHWVLSRDRGSANNELIKNNISCTCLFQKLTKSRFYLPITVFQFSLFLRKNQFNIIHYHQGGVTLILLALLFGKKAKVIHHLHSGNLIGDNTNEEISPVHLIFLKFISRYTIQIAVAEHISTKYHDKIKRTANLNLIENSVPHSFRSNVNQNNSIGFISRFTKEKGLDSFIEICSQLSSVKTNLNIYALGERNNIRNDVVKVISTTFNVDLFYENIDLLLFTSLAPEGLPLAVLEAISFDVAVIAYPIKGVVEILGDNYPLYIKSTEEAIRKIEKFYDSRIERERLSEIHQERCRKFMFNTMVSKIDSLYKILLRGKSNVRNISCT